MFHKTRSKSERLVASDHKHGVFAALDMHTPVVPGAHADGTPRSVYKYVALFFIVESPIKRADVFLNQRAVAAFSSADGHSEWFERSRAQLSSDSPPGAMAHPI